MCCLRVLGALGLVLGLAHAGAASLLAAILRLFDLLAALFYLLLQARPDLHVLGLILLEGVYGVVHAHEAHRLAPTEGVFEAPQHNAVVVGYLVSLLYIRKRESVRQCLLNGCR